MDNHKSILKSESDLVLNEWDFDLMEECTALIRSVDFNLEFKRESEKKITNQ